MASKKEATATVTFTTWHDGEEVQVEEGAKLPADHPVVQGHAEFFKPATATKAKVS